VSVGRAPGRVNLIGEHTDYNDGFVLPFAIQQRCTARVERADADVLVTSTQQDRPVRIPLGQLRPAAAWIDGADGWAAYAAGVVWALGAQAAWRISLDSTVPLGAGLSSSAAVGCSVAVALDRELGLGLSPLEIATCAIRSETEFVGAPTGGMDQLVSVLGRRDNAVLIDMRDRSHSFMPLGLDEAGLDIMVIDSHAPHRLVDGEYRQRRRSCDQAAARLGVPTLRDVEDFATLSRLLDGVLLRRAWHVVTENTRVLQVVELLRQGRPEAIGELLWQSHLSMREDFEITVPETDLIADTLMSEGARGARQTGGGFGGCVLALVRRGSADDLGEAVTKAAARHGFRAPSWFVAVPSDGAR